MIAWFAKNDVAANLLMVVIFALGIAALLRIPLEIFPEFESDVVQITVPFPGATPAEVESGIVLRIEDVIQDLRGIEEINAVARENSAVIFVKVDKEQDTRAMLEDIKNRVDGISTFPAEAERPVISFSEFRREVISVLVSGPFGEHELRQLGQRITLRYHLTPRRRRPHRPGPATRRAGAGRNQQSGRRIPGRTDRCPAL